MAGLIATLWSGVTGVTSRILSLTFPNGAVVDNTTPGLVNVTGADVGTNGARLAGDGSGSSYLGVLSKQLVVSPTGSVSLPPGQRLQIGAPVIFNLAIPMPVNGLVGPAQSDSNVISGQFLLNPYGTIQLDAVIVYLEYTGPAASDVGFVITSNGTIIGIANPHPASGTSVVIPTTPGISIGSSGSIVPSIRPPAGVTITKAIFSVAARQVA